MREREEEDEEEGVRVSESEEEREHALDEGGAREAACDWPVSPGEGAWVSVVSGRRACLRPSRSADVSDLNTSRGGCTVPAAHNTQARRLAHDSHTLHPHQREGGREEGGGRVDRVRQTNSEGR